VADERLLVGVDACVLIQSVKVPEGLCALILKLARRGAFRLLIPAPAFEEVRKQLDLELFLQLSSALAECTVINTEFPTKFEIDETTSEVLGVLRHVNDVPIAAIVKQHQPFFFVSSNRRHWTSEVGKRLAKNGRMITVTCPLEFLLALGVKVPPRRAQRRNASP
jgi:hypothetical protein